MGNTKGPLTNPEEITLLVFKDNQSARTFQISLGWISRIGLGLCILAGITLLSTFFAVKFYRIALRTNPAHVTDLEQEIQDLRAANKALETKNPGAPPLAAHQSEPVPAPTVPVGAPVTATQPGSPVLFSALPKNTNDLSANSAKLPIAVSPAKVTWKGKTLNVKFNIQYTRQDKGTQQGRIVILARGPNTLLAYPEGVLNHSGSASLIEPKRGEYFSVSRYRETEAEFGPVRSKDQLQDVEIMIFDSNEELLTYQKLVVPAGVEKPAPAKSPDLIEPGVDQ